MPNGFHGSSEHWSRMESTLAQLDPIIDAFAEEHGLAVRRSHRNWPSRTIGWGEQVHRQVHVYLADAEDLLFNVWAIAFADTEDERRTRKHMLAERQSVQQLSAALPEMLKQGYDLATSWKPDDLTNRVPMPGGPNVRPQQSHNRAAFYVALSILLLLVLYSLARLLGG